MRHHPWPRPLRYFKDCPPAGPVAATLRYAPPGTAPPALAGLPPVRPRCAPSSGAGCHPAHPAARRRGRPSLCAAGSRSVQVGVRGERGGAPASYVSQRISSTRWACLRRRLLHIVNPSSACRASLRNAPLLAPCGLDQSITFEVHGDVIVRLFLCTPQGVRPLRFGANKRRGAGSRCRRVRTPGRGSRAPRRHPPRGGGGGRARRRGRVARRRRTTAARGGAAEQCGGAEAARRRAPAAQQPRVCSSPAGGHEVGGGGAWGAAGEARRGGSAGRHSWC